MDLCCEIILLFQPCMDFDLIVLHLACHHIFDKQARNSVGDDEEEEHDIAKKQRIWHPPDVPQKVAWLNPRNPSCASHEQRHHYAGYACPTFPALFIYYVVSRCAFLRYRCEKEYGKHKQCEENDDQCPKDRSH